MNGRQLGKTILHGNYIDGMIGEYFKFLDEIHDNESKIVLHNKSKNKYIRNYVKSYFKDIKTNE